MSDCDSVLGDGACDDAVGVGSTDDANNDDAVEPRPYIRRFFTPSTAAIYKASVSAPGCDVGHSPPEDSG